MRKNIKNLVVILVLVSIVGSFFMFCSPSAGDACENFVNIFKKVVEDAGEQLSDEEVKTYRDECEAALKDADQKVIDCVANAKTAEDLDKCDLPDSE